MTLSEILEENSIRAISQKTNISEENIERVIAENFSGLAKAKALGFISIIERDFNADLKDLKEKALTYYAGHDVEEHVHIALPRLEAKRGRSKWFLVLMLALLAYATWYFFTQFDKKTLGTMLSFGEGKKVEVTTPAPNIEESRQEEVKVNEPLSISSALKSTQTDATGAQTDIVVASLEPNSTNASITTVEADTEVTNNINTDEETVQTQVVEELPASEVAKIVLKPQSRLWFGVIDMDTGKRDHFSISDKYEVDVKEKSWLVATSSAPFSFINHDVTQEFNDAKEHYFKVSKAGIETLSKAEYITLGGYRKW